jgi:opacity protein-like surface antigen
VAPTYVPPPPKKDNTGVLIAVVVVIILVVAIVASAWAISNAWSQVPWEDIDRTDLDMTVMFRDNNPPQLADPGENNKFVQLTVSLTNNRSSDLVLTPNDFLLETADGFSYGYSQNVPNTLNVTLSEDQTVVFKIGFEIPEGSTPTLLRFYLNLEWDIFIEAIVPS